MDYTQNNCEINSSQSLVVYRLEDMVPVVQKTVHLIVWHFDKTEMCVRQMSSFEQWELYLLSDLLRFYCRHYMYNEAMGLIKKLENLNLHYSLIEKLYVILGEHIGAIEVWCMIQQQKSNKIEKLYKHYEIIFVLQKSFIKTIAKLRQEQLKVIKEQKTRSLSHILGIFVMDTEFYTREDTKKENKGEN